MKEDCLSPPETSIVIIGHNVEIIITGQQFLGQYSEIKLSFLESVTLAGEDPMNGVYQVWFVSDI